MSIQFAERKYILWDGKNLYLKNSHKSEPIVLGYINTHKGGLTRVQKLKAVQFTNQWIEI